MLYGRHITFRSGSKPARAESLLQPDPLTGISREVSLEEFAEHGLQWDNGGSWWRTDVSSFAKKYKIEKGRSNGRGNKVTSLKTTGYTDIPISSRSLIPPGVRESLRGTPCAMLGSAVHGTIEIDHKNGYYSTGKELKDFQPLCKTANDAKRQYCKICKKTGKRYDARELGFSVGWIEGSSYFDKETECHGCYLFDPIEFRKEVSRYYQNKK